MSLVSELKGWMRVRFFLFYAGLIAFSTALGAGAALLLPYGRALDVVIGLVIFLTLIAGITLALLQVTGRGENLPAQRRKQ
jgi:hypothetical protein